MVIMLKMCKISVLIMDKLRIGSLNVRGLRDFSKRKEVFKYMKNKGLHVLCIQETHSTADEELLWKQQWGAGCTYYSHGSNLARGVAVFCSDSKVQTKAIYYDTEGRYVIINVVCKNYQTNIINIYAPNNDNPTFYSAMANKICELQLSELIIIGDFNLVLDPKLDRTENIQYHPKATRIIEQMMDNLDLCDPWRCKNTDSRTYSWTRKYKDRISGSRIDFALMTIDNVNQLMDIQYQHGYKSDHSLLILDMSITDDRRGPGLWKFNSKILHDKSFVDQCNQIIENSQALYVDTTPDVRWELTKNKLILWSKKYSQKAATHKRDKFNALSQKLEALKIEPPSEHVKQKLEHYTGLIEQLIEEQTKSSTFRTHCQYLRDNEKNTTFFFSLERKRYNQKTMRILKQPNGAHITGTKAILAEQHTFYAKLYSSDRTVKFTYEETNEGISENQKDNLDAEISDSEFTMAVKALKRNKTPGIDGLPGEFYQFFWPRISDLYIGAIRHAQKVGKLHTSARRGIITLIPKKDRDPLMIKNWRPLTMLTTDYKIFVSILAARIKLILPSIIGEHQTGFMQGRQISTTVRTTIDITQQAKSKKNSGYLLVLDFEKCFDRIEYSAITGSMRFFGMGENIVHWTELLLHGFQSCTVNNGFTSEFMDVNRSCHQGCPLAPFLYLLCGEVMSRKILNHSGINGITLNNLEKIIAQFADDTQLFLQNKASFQNAVRTLNDIEANTGLKVNFEKTSVITLGDTERLNCEQSFVWDPGGLNVLGINVFDTASSHYVSILCKAQKIIDLWNHRRLTLWGKVLVINTLVIPLFIYVLQVMEGPDLNIVNRFEKQIESFLWKGKRPKIPTSILHQTSENGGVKLVDLCIKNRALKIAWLYRSDELTQSFLHLFIPKYIGNLYWDCAINPFDIKKLIKHVKCDQFWKEIVNTWFDFTWKYRNHDDTDECVVLNTPIWLNSHIKIGGNLVHYANWRATGLTYVSDLISPNGQIKTFEQMEREYGQSVNWLQYNMLITAIPSKWFSTARAFSNSNETYSIYAEFEKKPKKSAAFYEKILEIETNDVTRSHAKLTKFFQLTYEEFTNAFVAIKKLTHITKYRDFQFRLLHSCIYTNSILYYWGKAPTKNCQICNETTKQTIVHLLVECSVTQEIWRKLKNLIETRLQISSNDVNFSAKNIFLNMVHAEIIHVINLMTLVTKQYIFYCKCSGKKPSYEGAIAKIRNVKQMEKYNAKIEYKYQKHAKRWSKIDLSPD